MLKEGSTWRSRSNTYLLEDVKKRVKEYWWKRGQSAVTHGKEREADGSGGAFGQLSDMERNNRIADWAGLSKDNQNI